MSRYQTNGKFGSGGREGQSYFVRTYLAFFMGPLIDFRLTIESEEL